MVDESSEGAMVSNFVFVMIRLCLYFFFFIFVALFVSQHVFPFDIHSYYIPYRHFCLYNDYIKTLA